jgi:hypothetical protein
VPVLPDGAGPWARLEGTARANQWLTPRNREAGSNLVDMGRCAARKDSVLYGGFLTPKPTSSIGGEARVKVCGVAVAMLPG